MTIVNKSGQTPGQAAPGQDRLNQRGGAARDRREGMDAFHPFDFSEQALLGGDPFSPNGSREDEDGRKRHGTSAHEERDAGAPKDDDAVVLAIVGAQPPHSNFEVEATPTVVVSAEGSGHVGEILSRIEQAVRASLHADGQAPLSLSVRLDDLRIPGLASLRIDMNASTLDVRLMRDMGVVTPQIVAAAQGLAQQLSVRFPNRVVRVLDAEIEHDAAQAGAQRSSGLAKISQLFDRRRRGP